MVIPYARLADKAICCPSMFLYIATTVMFLLLNLIGIIVATLHDSRAQPAPKATNCSQNRSINQYPEEEEAAAAAAAAWSSPAPNGGGVDDDDGRSGEPPGAAAEAATRHLRAGSGGRSRSA